jgi:hypothetical protein
VRIKLIVQSPSDKNRTIWLPYTVAWAAARGIARETHHVATLFGKFGKARFNPDGGGVIEWNEESTRPGETTTFGPNTVVAIH